MGRRIRDGRPSPAIVVAVLALVAALAGTALAGTDASTSAISKKKVKKIATKQINKLAPGLSVANADTAGNAGALGGKPPSAFAASASEPYREVGTPGQPQFQNGWVNYDSTAQSTVAFYRDPLGVVHLKGQIRAGTNGATLFTLPAGYRPAKNMVLPFTNVAGTGAVANLSITSDGRVTPFCGGGCVQAGMDGLTFRAGS